MPAVAASWSALDSLPPVPMPDGMRAAVLVPIWEDGDELRLILTRRPDDMRTHAGDVVFPGGFIERDDDGPVATAIREAWEEVGIPPDHVEVLGGLEPVSTRSAEMLIVPVVARIRRPHRLIPEPGEVAAIIEALGGMALAPDMPKARLKRYLRHPFIEDVLEVERLRALAIPHQPVELLAAWRFCHEQLEALRDAAPQDGLWPPIPIDGGDLQELGLQPGPLFRELLAAVETEALEGRVRDRESAIAFVKSWL